MEKLKKYLSAVSRLFHNRIFRSILLLMASILVFIFGMVVYGIVLNLREPTLRQAMLAKGFTSLNNANVLVERSKYTLSLYEDSVLIKSYRANFGRNLKSPKTRWDDNATPVGEYKICSVDTSHVYYKFFKLNYPNLDDAAFALRRGFISQKEFEKIKFDFYYSNCITTGTPLGGDIGIHGLGRLDYIFKNLPFVYNWTNGSIALSNENIDELSFLLKKGMKVVIK